MDEQTKENLNFHIITFIKTVLGKFTIIETIFTVFIAHTIDADLTLFSMQLVQTFRNLFVTFKG